MSLKTIDGIIYLDAQAFTTVTGDNHDLAISSSNLQVTCTSDNDGLTGFIPPISDDGGQVWVTNASSSNKLVLKANTGSTAGYRLILPDGNLTIQPGGSQQFGLAPGVGWIPIGGAMQTAGAARTWVNGVKKSYVKEYFATATVSNGTAVFYLTDDGTANGNAIFTNIYTESSNFLTLDLGNQYQFGNVVVAANKKSITVSVNRLGTIILGVIQFITAANGQTVYLQVKGD